MALASDRDTPRRESELLEPPVAANAVIHAGALVVIEAGYAKPGATATTLLALGRAEEAVSNAGGAAGAKRVKVRRGTFLYRNSGADPVLAADLLADCYVVDDETVARTNGGNTRSRAGRITGVETNGVWVEIR